MYTLLHHKELLQIHGLVQKLRKTEAETASQTIIHFQGTKEIALTDRLVFAV